VCGNQVAGVGPWSAIGAFRIEGDVPVVPPTPLPGAPTLANPTPDAVDVPVTPTLAWDLMPDVNGFIVQVATDDACAHVVFEGPATDTELAVPALADGKKHWWRVRATNAAGNGPWSDVRGFTTAGQAPPAAGGGVVVYSTVGGRGSQVAMSNVDGTKRRIIVPRTVMYPAISRDGTRIAYCATVGAKYQVFVANIDGTNEQQVTKSLEHCWNPVFSADGRIAYVHTANGSMDLYSVNADGTGERVLTGGPTDDAAPRLSPDGKLLAFARRATKNPTDPAEIWLLDIAAGKLTQLTDLKARSWSPCFNADGTKLVYYSNTTGINQIYVMDLATKVSTKVSADDNLADINARFATDGRIIFVRGAAATRRLWIMNGDGTGARMISDDRTADYDPDCGPGAVE
jgi:hypothetical protein